MSDFKAKMYQIQFRLSFAPNPAWAAYSAPPEPIAGLRGPTCKGGEAKMYQIQVRLGLLPRPRWVSLQCYLDPPSWISWLSGTSLKLLPPDIRF